MYGERRQEKQRLEGQSVTFRVKLFGIFLSIKFSITELTL